MPSTLKYGITYPAGNVAPNVPLAMQTQAESTENAIKNAMTSSRHAELTSSITTAANSLYDPGVFTVDGARTFNNTFVQADVTGKIKILEAGVYAISIVTMSSTNPGNSFGLAKNAAGTVTYGASTNSNGAIWEICTNIPNLYLDANTIVWFRIQTANAVSTTSRLKVTRLQA